MSDTPPPHRTCFSAWHTFIAACLIVFLTCAGLFAWFAHRITNATAASVSITREFRDYLPSAGPTDGILETATCSVPETFTQTDSATLFNIIPLGTTVSEIRVPAVYRYHIQLLDPWKLFISGQVCLVMAPQFQPSLPPAIITSQMEKSTSAGWLSFSGETDLATLEQGITAELEKRANDQTHRDFVRESCRQSVAAFVKAWLMKEDKWRDDRFQEIVVVFPDEVNAQGVTIPSKDGPVSIQFHTDTR
jgi:hypothetical protein